MVLMLIIPQKIVRQKQNRSINVRLSGFCSEENVGARMDSLTPPPPPPPTIELESEHFQNYDRVKERSS